ncbi:MAG: hypothetical protein JNK12_20570 [Acidimicrobiales bacterium]|nr:hypothetical protein [Acidimicrobiales bacterium]
MEADRSGSPCTRPEGGRSDLRILIDRRAAGEIDDAAFVAAVVDLAPPTAFRCRDPNRPSDILDEVWAETAYADFPESGTRDEIVAAADCGEISRILRDVALDHLAGRAS